MGKVDLNIVTLRRVRYSDRHCIVTAWSREMGRVSLLVADGAGRTAARSRALTAPPGLLACVGDIRPGRDIYTVSQLRPIVPLAQVRSNPVKGMVAMFLAEVMAAVMNESQPDSATFDYISLSLRLLDDLTDDTAIANFHLCFLYQLGRFLGIEPDVSTWRQGRVLDTRDGVFRATPPPHADFLDQYDSATAASMTRMTFANLRCWKFTRDGRNRALDTVLRYLSLHLSPGLNGLQSLDVLRSLF